MFVDFDDKHTDKYTLKHLVVLETCERTQGKESEDDCRFLLISHTYLLHSE